MLHTHVFLLMKRFVWVPTVVLALSTVCCSSLGCVLALASSDLISMPLRTPLRRHYQGVDDNMLYHIHLQCVYSVHIHMQHDAIACSKAPSQLGFQTDAPRSALLGALLSTSLAYAHVC
jgi:hypothetical protein